MSRRTVALALGSAVGALALAWIALILPAGHRADSSAEEIVRLHGELAALARSPIEVPVTTSPSDPPKLQAALHRAIPPRPMGGGVIETLARAAREAGVDLSSIRLGASSAAAGQGVATTIPVQFSVRGGYRETVAFVDRLDQLVAHTGGQIEADGRLIAIAGMEIAASSGAVAGDSLTSRMQASSYTMLSQPSEGAVP